MTTDPKRLLAVNNLRRHFGQAVARSLYDTLGVTTLQEVIALSNSELLRVHLFGKIKLDLVQQYRDGRMQLPAAPADPPKQRLTMRQRLREVEALLSGLILVDDMNITQYKLPAHAKIKIETWLNKKSIW